MLKYFLIVLSSAMIILLVAQARRAVVGSGVAAEGGTAATPRALFDAWQREHVTAIDPSRVRHADLKKYLDGLRGEGLRVTEVGRSVANREIYQVEFGRGPLKVFMWSQMHGDEPTATSALIDLFHYLQKNRDLPWVAAVERAVTLRAVPMLNPDGAELYQRRNLQFIDINRDARMLSTPEGRLLKRLRDEWGPDIGFNLHNQGGRTAVGETKRQATISLLAVPFDERGSDNAGRVRGKKICAVIIESLSTFIRGNIARYDDTFNPRAFGDLISKWGTPVVLIETGSLRGKTEMDLVQLNFVALASVLNALATGEVDRANAGLYDALEENTGGTLYSLIVRNATVVNRFQDGGGPVPPFPADIAVNEEGPGAQRQATVQEVGDLQDFRGLVEVDAAGFFVTVARGALRPGNEAALLFYRKEKAGGIDWAASDLEARFPPEAAYRNGEWVGGERLKIKAQ